MSRSEQVGTLSLDTAKVAVVDAMYLLTDEDHDAGKTAEDVAPGYGAALVDLRRDGEFPVFVDYDDDGAVLRIRIEAAP